jgi:hypothetical protein
MRFLHRRLHGLDDLYIASASAEIPRQRSAYFGFSRCWVASQQRLGCHDHSWRAKTTLRPELLMEGTLQSAEPTLRRQAFNRFDVTALAADCKRDAGRDRFTIDQNRTRTALTTIAAGFHTGEVRDVAQVVDQQVPIGHGIFAPTVINAQSQ